MKLLSVSVMLFIASYSYSQNAIISVSFLKNDGRHVNIRDSADYFRIITAPDSGSVLYNVGEYYKNGKTRLRGQTTTPFDPPTFEGQCVRFYANGFKQSIVTYKKGRTIGNEYTFYPNGKRYAVKEYDDNGSYVRIESNYLIKENYDSLGVANVVDGNGYYKGYDDKFRYIEEEGPVKDGKRDASWKGYSKNSKINFTETYTSGQLISGTATSEDGITSTYTKTRETYPEFNGGITAFYKYLGRNIRYPWDDRERNIQGRVVVQFVVERDGKVSDIEVTRSVSPSIDAEAVRVIANSPKWVPGVQFGRNVRTIFSAPISFSLRK